MRVVGGRGAVQCKSTSYSGVGGGSLCTEQYRTVKCIRYGSGKIKIVKVLTR
jgi:hypothetical protein